MSENREFLKRRAREFWDRAREFNIEEATKIIDFAATVFKFTEEKLNVKFL